MSKSRLIAGVIILVLMSTLFLSQGDMVQKKENSLSRVVKASEVIHTGTRYWTNPYGDPENNPGLELDTPEEPVAVWETRIKSGVPEATPYLSSFVVHQDTVFATSPDFNLYSINGSTGDIIDKYYLGQAAEAPPVYASGRVYAVTKEASKLEALSVNAQGELSELWSTGIGGRVSHSINADDSRIYVGLGNGSFQCFLASTGTLVWSYDSGSKIHTPPALHAGDVFFANETGTVIALSGSDGSEKWHYNTYSPLVSSPVYHQGHVYVGNKGGGVHCINASDGSQSWSLNLPYPVQSTGTVADDVLYICSGNVLYALGAEGQGGSTDILWNHTLGSTVRTKLVTSQSRLLVYSKDGVLRCVDTTATLPSEERVLWTNTSSEIIVDDSYAPPVLGEADIDQHPDTSKTPVVYKATIEGNLLCLSDTPDFTGSMEDISVNDEKDIFDGEVLNVTAKVWNKGKVGGKVNIELYEILKLQSPWNLLASAREFITPGSYATITASWTAKYFEDGSPIYVRTEAVDLPESNTDNNIFWHKYSLRPLPTNVWTCDSGTPGGTHHSNSPDVNIGKVAWSANVTDYGLQAGPALKPLVYEGRFIIPTGSGEVICARTNDPEELLWQSRIDDIIGEDVSITGQAAAYDKVFLTLDNDELIALDILSGELVWQSDLKSEGGLTYGNGSVICLGQSGFRGFEDDTGALQWNFSVPMIPVGYRYDPTDQSILAYNSTSLIRTGLDGTVLSEYLLSGTEPNLMVDNKTGNIVLNDGSNIAVLKPDLKPLNYDTSGRKSGLGLLPGFNAAASLARLNGEPNLLIVNISDGKTATTYNISELALTGDTELATSRSMIYINNGTAIAAYSLKMDNQGKMALTHGWTTELDAAGWEMALAEGKVIGTNGDKITALGSVNSPPKAEISKPPADAKYLENQQITFDGSPSYDPDGDTLSYTWRSNISGIIGTGEHMTSALEPGEHVITLEVLDEYGGADTAFESIVVLESKVETFVNESIAEPFRPWAKAEFGGSGEVSITPTSANPLPADNFDIGMYFRIEENFDVFSLANISIGYSAEDIEPGVNELSLGIWRYEEGSWSLIEHSGMDIDTGRVWANVTTLSVFTVGAEIENRVPQLRNPSVSPRAGYPDTEFNYTVTYTDLDNDEPLYVKVHIDENITLDLSPYQGSNYAVGVIFYTTLAGLEANTLHYFKFEANDGTSSINTSVQTGPGVGLSHHPPEVNISLPHYEDRKDNYYVLHLNKRYDFKALVSDKDDDPLTLEWEFGDGETRPGINVSKVYTKTGVFVVTLRVSDGEFNVTDTISVKVTENDTGAGEPGMDATTGVLTAILIILAAGILAYLLHRKSRLREEERLKESFFIGEGEIEETANKEKNPKKKEERKEGRDEKEKSKKKKTKGKIKKKKKKAGNKAKSKKKKKVKQGKGGKEEKAEERETVEEAISPHENNSEERVAAKEEESIPMKEKEGE